MADERLKRGSSDMPVSGGVTDDASLETKMLRVDPTTLRLKTLASIVTQKSATMDEGSGAVSVGATTTVVAATNSDRIKIEMWNDSNEVIYLGYGEAAVMNQGPRLNPNGGYKNEPNFTGAINAICASGTKVLTFIEM